MTQTILASLLLLTSLSSSLARLNVTSDAPTRGHLILKSCVHLILNAYVGRKSVIFLKQELEYSSVAPVLLQDIFLPRIVTREPKIIKRRRFYLLFTKHNNHQLMDYEIDPRLASDLARKEEDKHFQHSNKSSNSSSSRNKKRPRNSHKSARQTSVPIPPPYNNINMTNTNENRNNNTYNITINNGNNTNSSLTNTTDVNGTLSQTPPSRNRTHSKLSFYETWLKLLTKTHSDHGSSHYLVVWEAPNTTLVEIKNIHVLGLKLDGTDVLVYTYQPYSNTSCNMVDTPKLVNVYNGLTGQFRHDLKRRKLYATRTQIPNFHQCKLKCVAIDHPPDNIIKYSGNSSQYTIDGVGYKVIQVAAKHLNFTPEVHIRLGHNENPQHSWYYLDAAMDNITDELLTGKMDIAFGWFSYADPYLNPGVRLGRPTSIDCFGWGVPWRAGSRPSTWANYVNEFSLGTWACVILAYLLFVATLYCFESDRSREALAACVLYAYAMLMEQESKVKNNTTHLRIFLTNWLWYCLIITTAYRASLGSFMTVPAHANDFNSMTDILKSELNIVGGPDVLKIIQETAKSTDISRKFLKRYRTLQPGDFESIMNRTVVSRDIAVFAVKRFMYYHSRPQARLIKVKIPFRLIPGCLLRAHTTQLLVQRNSHLHNSLNKVLTRLFETGIIDHFIMHLGSNRLLPAEKIKGRPLRMKLIWCTFFILVAGQVISFIVFLLEVKYPSKIKHGVIKVKPRVDLMKQPQWKRQSRNFGQRHFYMGQYLW
ncbi:hypothetical protein M8J76_006708 [Diaphorina citri]|nr:hypothetical protein M8J76_006708 [Diaphorina citri]